MLSYGKWAFLSCILLISPLTYIQNIYVCVYCLSMTKSFPWNSILAQKNKLSLTKSFEWTFWKEHLLSFPRIITNSTNLYILECNTRYIWGRNIQSILYDIRNPTGIQWNELLQRFLLRLLKNCMRSDIIDLLYRWDGLGGVLYFSLWFLFI